MESAFCFWYVFFFLNRDCGVTNLLQRLPLLIVFFVSWLFSLCYPSHVHAMYLYAWLCRYDYISFFKTLSQSAKLNPLALDVNCNMIDHQLNLWLVDWFWKTTLTISCWFQNVHQGYPKETLMRFLKAREWNVSKAHKMVSFHTKFLNSGWTDYWNWLVILLFL